MLTDRRVFILCLDTAESEGDNNAAFVGDNVAGAVSFLFEGDFELGGLIVKRRLEEEPELLPETVMGTGELAGGTGKRGIS